MSRSKMKNMPYATMNDIIQQGKYKGETLGSILDKDAAYLYWMHSEKIIKLDEVYLQYCLNEKFNDNDIMASEIDIY